MMKKLPTAKNAELAQILNRGFVPGAYLYVKKTAKKSSIVWNIEEKCLSLQHERKGFPPAEMKE